LAALKFSSMHRTRIKICGFTRESDVEAAVKAGADAIGLNLYAPSSRSVTVQRALELSKVMPPFVTPVLLFVNASDELIAQSLAAIPHAVLQFHGDETPVQCKRAQRAYIRAARMETGFDLLNFAAQYSNAQALLVDAHVDGYGGGGKVFDWSLIPKNVPLPVVLSGGLHAGNVAAGVEQLRPWAVDVSSGVESAKGIKDAMAMRQFCDVVRAADARIASLTT
jgi:phosphoribosylanthranilate isomerase